MNLKIIAIGLSVLTIALFMVGGQTAWYVARASGFVALSFMVLSMAVGILGSTKSVKSWLPAADVYEVHRVSGYLTIIALAVHVIGLLADQYIEFGLSDVLIPGMSDYRPVPVALGIVATYMVLAIVFSFDVKKWIGKRVWRWIHILNFPLLIFALVHSILAGTDTPTAPGQLFYYSIGLIVFAMTIFRLLSPRRKATPRSRS